MTDDFVRRRDLPPLFAAVAREMRQVRPAELGSTTTRMGTALNVDSQSSTVDVQLDGDDPGDAAACQIIGSDPVVGGRVLVLFSPPSGAYAIGTSSPVAPDTGGPGGDGGGGGGVEVDNYVVIGSDGFTTDFTAGVLSTGAVVEWVVEAGTASITGAFDEQINLSDGLWFFQVSSVITPQSGITIDEAVLTVAAAAPTPVLLRAPAALGGLFSPSFTDGSFLGHISGFVFSPATPFVLEFAWALVSTGSGFVDLGASVGYLIHLSTGTGGGGGGGSSTPAETEILSWSESLSDGGTSSPSFVHASGAALLDVSTPTVPVAVGAGTYAIDVTMELPNTVSAGGYYAIRWRSGDEFQGVSDEVIGSVPQDLSMSVTVDLTTGEAIGPFTLTNQGNDFGATDVAVTVRVTKLPSGDGGGGGGSGGVSLVGEETLDTTGYTTVPSETSTPLPWTHSLGDALMDLTDPLNPTVVAEGLYLIAAFVGSASTSAPSGGRDYRNTVVLSTDIGGFAEAWGNGDTGGPPLMGASVQTARWLAAGAPITVEWTQYTGVDQDARILVNVQYLGAGSGGGGGGSIGLPVTFSFAGPAVAATESGRWYPSTSGTPANARISARIAPSGGDLTVDISVNGSVVQTLTLPDSTNTTLTSATIGPLTSYDYVSVTTGASVFGAEDVTVEIGF